MKPILFVMVGPSGSGKSTIAGRLAAKYDAEIVSSDAIREKIHGDVKNQSNPGQIFSIFHDRIGSLLKKKNNVIADATNLKKKDRMLYRKYLPLARIVYVVVNRPIEEIRKTAGWRNEVPPSPKTGVHFMDQHQQTFQSNLDDILSGDGFAEVVDLRGKL